MRLVFVNDRGEFKLTNDLRHPPAPYAILSHTWGTEDDEVLLHEIEDGTYKNKKKKKLGYAKLMFCARQAKRDGFDYFWIDTCCIDKRSSLEVSEAINSMFSWYEGASKCYVYLSDLSLRDVSSAATLEAALRGCRWFTRGWTLQELLAPRCVEFYCHEQQLVGCKDTIAEAIQAVTGIPTSALLGTKKMSEFDIRERVSWVQHRKTLKPEDRAYCMIGIFGVVVSLVYGGGEDHAWHRLQDAIVEKFKRELDSILPPMDAPDTSDRVILDFREWGVVTTTQDLPSDNKQTEPHTIIPLPNLTEVSPLAGPPLHEYGEHSVVSSLQQPDWSTRTSFERLPPLAISTTLPFEESSAPFMEGVRRWFNKRPRPTLKTPRWRRGRRPRGP